MESLRGQYNIKSLLMSRTIEKRRNKISTFLVTLRHMLNNQPPQFIAWGEQQNSFKIKNPSRFSEEVLPKYFKHSNLSSFIRQLNIYDFKKVSNEKYPDEYIYSHPYFDKNRPELMKNIYRKVHNLGSKNAKDNQDAVLSDSNSQENSTTHEKKKLKEEMQVLEQKLNDLKCLNTTICEQNLQLESKISDVKNSNSKSSKYFYQILMQSYEVQYFKFAQKIQNQLTEQTSLLSEVYQRQRLPEPVTSHFIQTKPKQSFNFKSKVDPTNYNSTSSGGSFNGNSSKNKQRPVEIINDKFFMKLDKKNQLSLKEQNNVNFKNHKNYNDEYKSTGIGENEQYLQDNNMSGLTRKYHPQSGNFMKNNMFQENIEGKNDSEQDIFHHPQTCVINLKRANKDEHNIRQTSFQAIVLKALQEYNKLNNYNSMLYSS